MRPGKHLSDNFDSQALPQVQLMTLPALEAEHSPTEAAHRAARSVPATQPEPEQKLPVLMAQRLLSRGPTSQVQSVSQLWQATSLSSIGLWNSGPAADSQLRS